MRSASTSGRPASSFNAISSPKSKFGCLAMARRPVAVRWLITVAIGTIFTLKTDHAGQPATIPGLRCTVCGGLMSIVGFAPAPRPAVFDTS